MNINIFSSINSSVYKATEYMNMLASNCYFPLITLPTRITNKSSTVIDHIMTNDHKNSILPGIIKTDLSDHFPIFCSIDTVTSSNKT